MKIFLGATIQPWGLELITDMKTYELETCATIEEAEKVVENELNLSYNKGKTGIIFQSVKEIKQEVK